MNWIVRAARDSVRLAQTLVPTESRGVTILAYHLVGADTQSIVDLPVDVFRAHLCELSALARVCSLSEAVQHLQTGNDSPLPLVVVTFDDAYDNFRTRAWPLLKELEIPCTLYVPVGFIEGTSATPLRGAEHLKPMEWSALRELGADPLLTLGSHSWNHQDLPTLRTDELRADLLSSRERLQDCTGASVEHFCYPRAKWSRAAEQEVATVYRAAVVAGGRKNVAGRFHPLRLSRVPLRRDMRARLASVMRSPVWLEEWMASHARALTS